MKPRWGQAGSTATHAPVGGCNPRNHSCVPPFYDGVDFSFTLKELREQTVHTLARCQQISLKSVLRCSVCGATRTKFDPFMYLSLPMPRVGAGEVLIAAAVVVAACCCCAMAVGLWTAATMGREEDDDPPEQVREIQLHGLRPWKAPDGDNVVVGG